MTALVRRLIRNALYHPAKDGKPGWYEVSGEDFRAVLFALGKPETPEEEP